MLDWTWLQSCIIRYFHLTMNTSNKFKSGDYIKNVCPAMHICSLTGWAHLRRAMSPFWFLDKQLTSSPSILGLHPGSPEKLRSIDQPHTLQNPHLLPSFIPVIELLHSLEIYFNPSLRHNINYSITHNSKWLLIIQISQDWKLSKLWIIHINKYCIVIWSVLTFFMLKKLHIKHKCNLIKQNADWLNSTISNF